MMISYGHQIDPKDDHFVNLANQALACLSKAGIFGSFTVDYIPMCKYIAQISRCLELSQSPTPVKHLPSWLPGAGFKRQAHTWSRVVRAMIDEPFAMVKDRMVRGMNHDLNKDLSLLTISYYRKMGTMFPRLRRVSWIFWLERKGLSTQRNTLSEPAMRDFDRQFQFASGT